MSTMTFFFVVLAAFGVIALAAFAIAAWVLLGGMLGGLNEAMGRPGKRDKA